MPLENLMIRPRNLIKLLLYFTSDIDSSKKSQDFLARELIKILTDWQFLLSILKIFKHLKFLLKIIGTSRIYKT